MQMAFRPGPRWPQAGRVAAFSWHITALNSRHTGWFGTPQKHCFRADGVLLRQTFSVRGCVSLQAAHPPCSLEGCKSSSSLSFLGLSLLLSHPKRLFSAF